jgi:hypothetical protein
VNLINIFSTPSPKTRVVQSHTVLHKPGVSVLLIATTDPYPRASANVIEKVLAAEGKPHTQKGEERFIELSTAIPLAYRKNDMRHAVDLDHAILQTTSHSYSHPKLNANAPL